VSHEKFPDISTSPLLFLQGFKKWANFAPIFDPTRIPSTLVSKQSNIENLKNAQNAQMIGLKMTKIFPLSLPKFLQGVKKPQVCPILPNFAILGALVSK